MTGAAIPFGCWWSTPFARWQGSLSHLHSLRFAAHVARGELGRRSVDPAAFDLGLLGTTIPQEGAFYGAPWVMGLIGAGAATGPTVSQACATGARLIAVACAEVERGNAAAVLAIAADRTSNGPQIVYPDPKGPGGAGRVETWVLDSFRRDPLAGVSMIETAEAVAAEHGIDTAEQNDVTLRRYEQYADALADDRAFQRRYMTLPFEVPGRDFAGSAGEMTGDEGVQATTAEGLARLRPVLKGGTVTNGGQTHPADGNAGIVVTTPDRAREMARDASIAVRVLGAGQARARLGHMPAAPVPAARRALEVAGLGIGDIDAVKTHNPFVVNDIVLGRALGIDPMTINDYGCSLVWGHPQAPTGLRAVIELIEALALRGGGRGLFTGCAAGDGAMALVFEVRGA